MTVEATPLAGAFPAAALAEGDWVRRVEAWRRLGDQAMNVTGMILAANMKMLTALTNKDRAPDRHRDPRLTANDPDGRVGVALPREETMTRNDQIDEAHFHKVSERAYAKWLDEGQAHGRDQEHWRDAEAEIIAEEEQEAAKASAPPPPATETPKPTKSGSKRAA